LIGSLGGIGELIRDIAKPGEGVQAPPGSAGVPLPPARPRSAVPRTGADDA
jgi:hypothetical protein